MSDMGITTSNDVGSPKLPQVMAGGKKKKIIRRKFPESFQSKKKFLSTLNEQGGNGNEDYWNNQSQLGSNWKEAYPILAAARKTNPFDPAKGQVKAPGFFFYLKNKKKNK